jgi:hypothetical protein
MHLLTGVRERLGRIVRFSPHHGPPLPERRQMATRPVDGDRRECPSCRGTLLFREKYLIMRTERNTMEPAWICYTHPCGYREFLRHSR